MGMTFLMPGVSSTPSQSQLVPEGGPSQKPLSELSHPHLWPGESPCDGDDLELDRELGEELINDYFKGVPQWHMKHVHPIKSFIGCLVSKT